MGTQPMLAQPARPGGGRRAEGNRRWRRRLATALVPAVAAVAATVIVATPAHAVTTRLTIGAGLSSCPAGYVCLWTLNGYTGSGYAFYNSETDYSTLPAPFNGIQDNSWSFYNHGNTSDIMFFRDANYGGDWFVLCRGDAIAQLPANSSLPTSTNPSGGDTEPGRGWRDSVSGHHFGAWC